MWKWTIVWIALAAADADGRISENTKGTAFSSIAKPVEKPAMPPREVVQFVGSTFSTDLPLAECKQPVHRVWLQCQLTDGGPGALILDPSVPKFDEFGDQTGVVKPSPLMRLDFTLKLIKKEKGRTLYAIRGPKIVSRITFVAYKDIMPWGDGRLLVYGKDMHVRYVIDLFIPRPPPAKARPVVKMPPP